jgi:hypothetical protein
MERHERLPQIKRKSSCGQPTQCGLHAWDLSKGVTTPHHKNQAFYDNDVSNQQDATNSV